MIRRLNDGFEHIHQADVTKTGIQRDIHRAQINFFRGSGRGRDGLARRRIKLLRRRRNNTRRNTYTAKTGRGGRHRRQHLEEPVQPRQQQNIGQERRHQRIRRRQGQDRERHY